MITRELIHFPAIWINTFLVKSGKSQLSSRRKIVWRHWLDAAQHCKMPFGAYSEMHDEPHVTNLMQAKTHGAISIGPTRNMQGSFKFLCLEIEKK